MFDIATIIGGLAAIGTTLAHLPQLAKVWRTRETGDLSLKMLIALWSGLALWVAYGVMQEDWVIVLANVVSVALVSAILAFKLRTVFS